MPTLMTSKLSYATVFLSPVNFGLDNTAGEGLWFLASGPSPFPVNPWHLAQLISKIFFPLVKDIGVTGTLLILIPKIVINCELR